ncbi:hypothetical protein BGZ93_007263 [Podila epicladia]|nr:hypothetical protein BGZ92_011326 [Podila epicladia]KAG0099505.1 hypothetical protein BGZ93_007263 [Podila epicladia]
MSRCNTHYDTQDGYPLFYGRPVDDPDDYDCRTQAHPVPTSRLLIPPQSASTLIKLASRLSISAARSTPGFSATSYKTCFRKLPCVPPTPSVLGYKRKDWDEKAFVGVTDAISRRKKRCQDPEPVPPGPKSKPKSTPRPMRKTSRYRSAARNKGCTRVWAFTSVTTQLAPLLALNLTSLSIALALAQVLQSFNATAASGALGLPPIEDIEDIVYTGRAVELHPYLLQPTSQQHQQKSQYQQQHPFQQQLH